MATVELPRRPRLGLLNAAVSALALGAIVWWAVRQHAPHVPLNPRSLGDLAAALAVYACATALRGERWHRILAREGAARGRGESNRLILVGYMGNNTLPARAGDFMRVLLFGGRRRVVLGTVLAERVLDAVALVGIFAVVVVAKGLGFGPLPYVLGAVGGVVVLAAAALLVPGRGLLTRARDWLRPVLGATRGLASAYGAVLLAGSLALWCCEASVYLLVGHAVGVPLTAAQALYVMALTNLSMLVPAAPGYVGTFDAAVLLALRSLHLPALGYLLVLRFVLFVPITVAGFCIYIARYARRRA